MKASEWVDTGQAIAALWPQSPPSDETLAAWFTDVEDLPAQVVRAAVRVIAREGREFPPTGGMIRQRAAELAVDAPDWAEVARWLRRYVATGVTNPAYGTRPIYAERGAAVMGHAPPMVASFVGAVGDRQLWESAAQGGNGEARMREMWTAYARRVQRETALYGLPGALRALRRINSAPTPLGELGAGTTHEEET